MRYVQLTGTPKDATNKKITVGTCFVIQIPFAVDNQRQKEDECHLYVSTTRPEGSITAYQRAGEILNFGSVSLGSVNTASNRIWMDIDTNAESGGYVYIYSANNGLLSAHTSHTISSVTGNLAALSEGFGIQNNSATQTSGGPLTALSPYNGAADNVGIVNSTIRELYSTGTNPIVGGRASVTLKMKPSASTPASSDYSDTLTLIAAGTF